MRSLLTLLTTALLLGAAALPVFAQLHSTCPILGPCSGLTSFDVEQIAKAVERQAWDKIKDSGDQAAIQAFIKQYPDSPFATSAQSRLATLQRIAKEQEEKGKAK
jgi:hypothetical protein